MNNQTQTKAVTQNVHVCPICTRPGANWLLTIEGKSGQRVHRPCGKNALKAAPEGVKAELNPTEEQKRLWREQRDTRQVQNFWNDAFAKAKPLKVAAPSPVPVEVAQAA
jgi:hypothetical protein